MITAKRLFCPDSSFPTLSPLLHSFAQAENKKQKLLFLAFKTQAERGNTTKISGEREGLM